MNGGSNIIKFSGKLSFLVISDRLRNCRCDFLGQTFEEDLSEIEYRLTRFNYWADFFDKNDDWGWLDHNIGPELDEINTLEVCIKNTQITLKWYSIFRIYTKL